MSDHSNLATLFAQAAEFESDSDRVAFLAASCGSDSTLRQELEELLAAHVQAGAFMETPAADAIATECLSNIAERPGAVIGHYKLLEQIGEGGMGLVFMAEQSQPLRRRVALKIIKPGLDTRSVIARFEAERQALALMDHPNIARVYDAGATESGHPYFVMELVHGTPITDYCRDHNFPLRARLALFIDVCHAVQHAHQKGIIHRDLKPTNILVAQSDTAPVPKVIDFGVAKATIQPLTDRTLFTSFAQIIGTPLYMSPEQADLGNQDIDTRSDVYSLGVILYELLTDATPFDAERLRSVNHDELRRIIREEEPPKPSTRATTVAAAISTVTAQAPIERVVDAAALKGDLDWIVMKALEKDRQRRYESPGALADDIDRYLKNQPVDACPPTRRYRLLKFTRRNRALLLTTGAIAAAMLIGTSVSLWQAARARAAEERATRALATAEARLKTARQAVDDMYIQVVEKWLFKEGILTPVQHEFLQKAVAFYEDFAAQNPDSPQARFDVALAQRRQASILYRLGDVTAAEAAYRNSIEQFVAVLPELSDPVRGRFELAVSLQELGENMRFARRYDEAEPLLKRAVSTWEDVVAQAPSQTKIRGNLGVSYFALASVFLDQGRNDQAEKMLRRSREHFEAVLAQEPENAKSINHLATAELSFAEVLTQLGRLNDARPLYLHSIELRRRAVEIDPVESEFRSDLALALSKASAKDAVEDHLPYDQEAYEIARGLAEQFPDRPRYLELLVVSQQNLVTTLEDHDRKKMLAIARSGPDLARRLKAVPGNPDYHRYFVDALIVLHQSLLANKLPDEAAKFRREAIDEVRADPACREHLGYLRKILAADLCAFGHPQAAIPLMHQCLAADASQAGPLAHVVLALSHAEVGEMDVARTWLAKATPLPEPQPKSDLSKFLRDKAIQVFNLKVDSNGAQ